MFADRILAVVTVLSITRLFCCRCGNVAAILELDEHLEKSFTIFEAAPQVFIHPQACRSSNAFSSDRWSIKSHITCSVNQTSNNKLLIANIVEDYENNWTGPRSS